MCSLRRRLTVFIAFISIGYWAALPDHFTKSGILKYGKLNISKKYETELFLFKEIHKSNEITFSHISELVFLRRSCEIGKWSHTKNYIPKSNFLFSSKNRRSFGKHFESGPFKLNFWTRQRIKGEKLSLCDNNLLS